MKDKVVEKLRCLLSRYFETSDAIEKFMVMCKVDAYLDLISLSDMPQDLAKKVVFYNVSLMRVSS